MPDQHLDVARAIYDAKTAVLRAKVYNNIAREYNLQGLDPSSFPDQAEKQIRAAGQSLHYASHRCRTNSSFGSFAH
jgi:hypothetical protein